jgi:putative ABC transport system permease protein
LIALLVRHELSFDRHYTNKDRLYRVVAKYNISGQTLKGVYFPAPLAKALETDFPEIEKAGHYGLVDFLGGGSNEFRRADKVESIHEDGFTCMDPSLLSILEIPFISGNPKTALSNPFTIVITKSKADKYFPDEDPLGKLVILNNDEKRQYEVTGVVEDFPATSHLQCDFILSLEGWEPWPGEKTDWRANNYVDYVLLRPDATAPEVEQTLSSVVRNYFLPAALNAGGDTREVTVLKSITFMLQPINDIYLNQAEVYDDIKHGNIRFVWVIGTIALFILLIACFNFINLSTAKSASRAREVGLRKVVGSVRSSLIKQFLLESLLFSFFSFVLGLALARLSLPYFNILIGKSLGIPWQLPVLLPGLVICTLIVGILAGLYPAFYLSSFKPISVLKGNVGIGNKGTVMRSALVVFQFTISIILIVGTVVVYRQMNYILTKKIGFDKEQVLVVQGTHTLNNKITIFKEELLLLSSVKHVSVSGFLPVNGSIRNGGPVWNEGKRDIEEPVNTQQWFVDHDYVKTLGLNILEGRDFLRDIPSDSQAVIVNQALVKNLGLINPVGKYIVNQLGTCQIIGVVEDFHFESMREHIAPLALLIGRNPDIVSVKINTSDLGGTIRSVSRVWEKFSPHQAFRYTFLDDSYARMYEDVRRMEYLCTTFSALAIMVACLGLFALSSFMTEQRRKEISIRLILGAPLKNILRLLTQNFIKLVFISFLIAAPIAWYGTQKWLEDYVYRIDVGWDVFLLSGVMAIGVTLLTVSYQSVRTALLNPVDNLRTE